MLGEQLKNIFHTFHNSSHLNLVRQFWQKPLAKRMYCFDDVQVFVKNYELKYTILIN